MTNHRSVQFSLCGV